MQGKRFDLLLLDIHLPDANGIEFLKTINKISPDTRIVIINWDGTIQNKESALLAGAEQFLEKPFDIGVVRRFVATAFREDRCLRKHSRFLCNIPLRLSILAPSPEEAQFDLDSLSGTAKDVGREGVRVNTEYPLKEGQGVRLRADDERDPFSKLIPHEANAEIVWAVPGGGMFTAGLRFHAEVPLFY